MTETLKKVGVAGYGTIGKPVATRLFNGIVEDDNKFVLGGIFSKNKAPYLVTQSFDQLAEVTDIGIEALPPKIASECAIAFLRANKDIVMATTGDVSTYPEILNVLSRSSGRIIIPYGALAALESLEILKQSKVLKASIVSTKPPEGFGDLYKPEFNDAGEEMAQIMFSGYATEAVEEFGKNANVSLSLSLACKLDPRTVKTEIWADPKRRGKGNRHHVTAEYIDENGEEILYDKYCDNVASSCNPKTSLITGESVLHAAINPERYAFAILDAKWAQETIETLQLAA